jgi:hypothetical protein
MTEKVDVAPVLAYKTGLDDMDFRCFNSVAASAVLMGSGACALFAPAAWAGDRIDFSAPAIPLSVPRRDVEVKEPTKMIESASVADSFMSSTEMAVPSQYVLVKPKDRDKNDWGLDARLNSDPSLRDTDDLFGGRPDPSRPTNSNNLNMKQGLNPKDNVNLLQERFESGFGGDQNESRFAAWGGSDRENSRIGERNGSNKDYSRFEMRNGLERDHSKYDTQNGMDRDKENARSSDRLGQGFSSGNDDSFLSKVLSRDPLGMDRYNDARSMSLTGDPKTFGDGAFGERINDPVAGQDSAHTASALPDYTGFNPLNDGQSRQFDEQRGAGQTSFQAWEPTGSSFQPSRSFSSQEQINSSRVVAPTRSAILAMPSRPGDPH